LALAWRKFRFVATADYYGLAKNPLRYAFFTNEWSIFQFCITADYADVALIGDFTTVPSCATLQVNAHDSSNCHRQLNASPLSPMLFLPKNIISNLFELFFSKKIPYTYHQVLYTDPKLYRLHYYNWVTQKRPTTTTRNNAHQERNCITPVGWDGQVVAINLQMGEGITDAKWLFRAYQ